jgi:hypothetical protein
MQRAMSIVSCLVLYVLAVSGQAAAAKCDPPCTRNGACVDSEYMRDKSVCISKPHAEGQRLDLCSAPPAPVQCGWGWLAAWEVAHAACLVVRHL